jgi:hypothetical protein
MLFLTFFLKYNLFYIYKKYLTLIKKKIIKIQKLSKNIINKAIIIILIIIKNLKKLNK